MVNRCESFALASILVEIMIAMKTVSLNIDPVLEIIYFPQIVATPSPSILDFPVFEQDEWQEAA